MQIYLVGGAVRDELLNRPVTERDYVVVGATPQQMRQKGFTQVGKDFPVFLHPKTKEEYALARTERKSGKGYTGFVCDASPEVSLEEDLQRRDLTVNAMAKGRDENIIDPFNGLQDINKRLLRHVSDAFIEDPLRVFRVARFAARYAHLGFHVAEETLTLMKNIAQNDELKHLSAERVWLETRRSLMEKDPHIFFEVLSNTNALHPWLQELVSLGDPELHALQHAAHNKLCAEVRFAALTCSLSQQDVKSLCQRLKAPNSFSELADLAVMFASQLRFSLKAEQLLEIFNRTDSWRRPQRFSLLLNVAACLESQDGFKTKALHNKIERALENASQIDVQPILEAGFTGADIKQQLNEKRRIIIEEILADNDSSNA